MLADDVEVVGNCREAVIDVLRRAYQREIGIIELYLSLLERVLENREQLPQEETRHMAGPPQRTEFEERLVKAKTLLEKKR